ncbi:MAG TPA: alpha-amylase family glycosyl hydrolase [Candidatus Limnocylindrales bacterium]
MGTAHVFEFHVSRTARDRYRFDDTLFGLTGNVVLPDFGATRRFAQAMNDRRDVLHHPEKSVLAGQLNAMGLIDEILHHVVALYREQVDGLVVRRALEAVEQAVGRERTSETLEAFADAFPTVAVYRGDLDGRAWLEGSTVGPDGQVPNREIALEELLLLWLANVNPAFAPFGELFDDRALRTTTAYRDVVAAVGRHMESRPTFGPDGQPLVDMLRAPAVASPDSLPGQLRFIRERWGLLLGRYLDRLVISLDVLAEEERAHWLRFHGAGDGRQPGQRPGLGLGGGGELEPERFSQDLDWMPRLVLMAKSTYVWLDQLSRAYGGDIRTLDAIPDEELDRLAHWGMSGLWLIGLWERSRASQEIKRRRGNPEAVASAYSLMDYRIADDLGGEAAYANLRDRASRRGIRLASDMVPNHMGIDSTWVVEHPERFLALPYPPYPSYSYTGPDLSWDSRVGIFLEDHYWESSDAAVTFKRVDRGTGDERFIYHGNDGTSFPWNDTAQLDYLSADVREAVIQTILQVARRFPVIRFDAAMTLAKRHIQRLWFPEPGSGGGIPSRAEHGLSRADFDALMPVEFWREVVDRVAAEAPDTLLLAEAFWMLEGYFVRSLGMHRVYNSAFMHMLRDEDNAGYRRAIKETLEFDPEILKRYVNFMNNPDEKTAVEQFGKGDKYFGIATLMVTLPGLPMFGHGQVEGFGEKYGMEYRRAYHDEGADPWLVERHEREIFPLLHRRQLFAGVSDFLFYDFERDDGGIDENVFAYSNRWGGERTLVVYHNRFGDTAGRVRQSVPYAVKDAGGGKSLRVGSLAEGLDLPADDAAWLVFREARTGLEFLRGVGELRRDGLWVTLDAYRTHVFLGFRVVHDLPSGQYRRLADRLAGRGVPSIEEALRELQLEPVHAPLRLVLSADVVRAAVDGDEEALDELEARLEAVLSAVAESTGVALSDERQATIARRARAEVAAINVVARLARAAGSAGASGGSAGAASAVHPLDDPFGRATAAAVVLVRALGATAVDTHVRGSTADVEAKARTRDLVTELRLRPILAAAFRDAGLDEAAAWSTVAFVGVLAGLPLPSVVGGRSTDRARRIVSAWLDDPEVRPFIRVNRWEGVAWFEKEAFEKLTAWMVVLETLRAAADDRTEAAVKKVAASSSRLADDLRASAEASGYRVDELLTRVGRGPRRPRGKPRRPRPAVPS